MSNSKAQDAAALSFNSTTFDVVTREGERWLQAADIARALGYARADKISQIYSRHADEFTTAMAQTLNLRVNGINDSLREKEVRIFSLRGAHLLAMFARTPVAKAFRKWVLDVLDREVAQKAADPVSAMTLTDCGDKAKVSKFLVAMRKRAVEQLVQLDKQITEWEVLDKPAPAERVKIEVTSVVRAPGGAWVMEVVSGMCGFTVSMPNKVLPRGGVKVGDKLDAYFAPGGDPWRGPWVRVERRDAKPSGAIKYAFGSNYAALEMAA